MAFQNPAIASETFIVTLFRSRMLPRIAITLAIAGFVFWTFAYVCGTQIFQPGPGATLMTVRVILEFGFLVSVILAGRWIIAGFRTS